MSERKVLNKYIPPNFDPKNLSTVKKGPGKHKKVRLMAPFSMRCNTCGEFIYKGKKFNARKESSHGETYLGIQIWRFYITCPVCISEITFKTDPKNTDYTCELGATRNYEPWRDETAAHQQLKADRLKLEEDDAMLALENKTYDSKIELDVLDALDELRTKNALMEKKNPDEILERLQNQESRQSTGSNQSKYEIVDEELASSIFQDSNGETVKRVAGPPEILSTIKEVDETDLFTQIVSKRTPLNLGIKRKTDLPVDVSEKKTKLEAKPALTFNYPDSDSD